MIKETFTTKTIVKLYESNIDFETKRELISRLMISNIYALNEKDNRALYGPMMHMNVLLTGEYLKNIALQQPHDKHSILSVYTKERHISSICDHFTRNYVFCSIIPTSELLKPTRIYSVSNFDFVSNDMFAYMDNNMIYDIELLYNELKKVY